MKKIIQLVAILALAIVALPAKGQGFVTGPVVLSMVTNSFPFAAAVNATTNLTEGQKRTAYLGGNGFAASAWLVFTNANAVTNITITWELSVDGTNYTTTDGAGDDTIDWVIEPFGTTNTVKTTNIAVDVLKNYKSVRLKSIANPNLVPAGHAWFSNLVYGIRQ